MNHSEMTELLSAYVNGEVSPSQREYIETHLVTCASCQGELAEFRSIRVQLVSLRDYSVPQESRDVTMTTIRAERLDQRTGGRLLRPVLAAGFALAVAVAITVTLLVTGGGDGAVSGIARAYDDFAGISSYRMSGTTMATSNGESQNVEFDWSFSGGGDARGVMTGVDGTTEFIIHEGLQYSHLSAGSGGVLGIIDGDVLSPIPTRDGTLDYLRSLLNVEELGNDNVNGVPVRKFTGKVDLDGYFDGLLAQAGSEEYQATSQFLEIQRRSEINVELWIGVADDRLRRIVIDGRLVSASSRNGEITEGPATTYHTVADYLEFDEQSEVFPPVNEDGSLLPGWSSMSSSDGPAPTMTLEAAQ